MNGDYYKILKCLYNDIQDFYKENSIYISKLITLWNIKSNVDCIKKLLKEYNSFQHSTLKVKWWKETFQQYLNYKQQLIQSKSLSATEIWLFTDTEWLAVLKNDINIVEDEVEKVEDEKVEVVDEKVESVVEEVKSEDDKLSEELISKMLEEMVFEEDIEEKKEEIKIMRLIDDNDEQKTTVDLRSLSVVTLKEMCKNRGIKPIPKLKQELINALSH
jgi:hypothetical protein